MKKGLLLVNLGTPKSPSAADVGVYLKEFLSDPFVIDIPAPFRWMLVNWLIVPRRKYASSELYEKIWSDRGSPLLFHTADLAKAVQSRLPSTQVEFCMRYGEPSIAQTVEKFRGVSELTVFPLYPQYSLAASESSIVAIRQTVGRMLGPVLVHVVPPFYDHDAYLNTVAEISRPQLESFAHDHVLFSYHGLPVRQSEKTTPTYREQCFETSKHLAAKLGLKEADYTVAFQSRLKGTPWVQPFSDVLYEQFPKRGIKRLAVLCPSFVADCLETLEEVAIRGKKQFVESGGEDLKLVCSLNAQPKWVDGLVEMATNPKRTQKSAAPQSLHPTL